jgi:ssDNA-binding Zn-finger/Zn-ribbon topoisomerase 1
MAIFDRLPYSHSLAIRYGDKRHDIKDSVTYPRGDTMVGDIQRAGQCPKCHASSLMCKYNHFESDELVIDAWEHKCTDCGFRETQAVRSDDDDAEVVVTEICPYCGRRRGDGITRPS